MTNLTCTVPEAGAVFLECVGYSPFNWLLLLSTIGTLLAVAVALYFGWRSSDDQKKAEKSLFDFQRHQDQLAAFRAYTKSQGNMVANCTLAGFDDRTAVNELTADWQVYAMYFKPENEELYDLSRSFISDLQTVCSQIKKYSDQFRNGQHTGAGIKESQSHLVTVHGNWMGNLAEWHTRPDHRVTTMEKLRSCPKYLTSHLGALIEQYRKDKESPSSIDNESKT